MTNLQTLTPTSAAHGLAARDGYPNSIFIS
jgi:hypothetical protein